MTQGGGRFDSAVLSQHAKAEMVRRGISESEVRDVLVNPGRREQVRAGRVVLSSLQQDASTRSYVLRVFVDIDRSPPVVVTAYRSSKIGKYWSQP